MVFWTLGLLQTMTDCGSLRTKDTKQPIANCGQMYP